MHNRADSHYGTPHSFKGLYRTLTPSENRKANIILVIYPFLPCSTSGFEIQHVYSPTSEMNPSPGNYFFSTVKHSITTFYRRLGFFCSTTSNHSREAQTKGWSTKAAGAYQRKPPSGCCWDIKNTFPWIWQAADYTNMARKATVGQNYI